MTAIPIPPQLLQNSDVQRHLEIWLAELSEKQCAVVERRFGLRGREVSTLEKIGVELGRDSRARAPDPD